MMLEVGEPGELPLMKELTTTLKKSQPKQSPLPKGTLSPHAHDGMSMQPLEDEGRAFREHHSQEYALNGAWDSSMDFRRDGAKNASHKTSKSPQKPSPTHFDPTKMRSPPIEDFNSKIMNWDDVAGDASRYAASKRASTDCLHRESLRNHLEKLGILGEGQGMDAHGMKETCLLHNLRNVGDEWQPHVIHAENFELEPSSNAWSQQENLHNHTYLKNHTGDFYAYKDMQRVRETSGVQKSSSRPTKGDWWWRANMQTAALSPLVLNPHDDNQRFSRAERTIFTLDQEFSDNDDDRNFEEEHIRTEKQVQQGKSYRKEAILQAGAEGGSRSRSPRQLHQKQEAPNCTRFSNLRPGTSETEFFEYDVEALEQPSKRKESGKSYDQKPLNHNQPTKRHSFAQEYPRTSANAVQSIRRNSSSFYERRPILQRQESIYTLRSPQIEPLPLLTELEDYNGSDEYGGSSNEGDFGRSSMSELQGEPVDLKACKNTHNAGRQLAESRDNERLQLAVRQDCKELALCEYHPRNLSQKYRPKSFEEVVGQHIVAQALSNAILKGRIAPVYLFQGTRGTGKTSAARIFASALLCISSEGKRPCGACRECISVAIGKSSEVKEVDAASNNGIERVKALLEETISAPPLSRYKVFIIDECHVLTTETWNALLKILEEPPINVVFILITTDADQLPRTTLSRCQKFPFPKIKESEIVKRLQKLTAMENLSIDPEILQLIASRSDGSLRDAETTLDQITLLGQHVNPSTLHELVGCAPDEKLLGLLEAALVADTINTVRRARELVDLGMEPLSLTSRIATLIADILAGSFKFTENQRRGFFQKQPLSDEKMERLRVAMKILAEAEKQLRVSNDRTTWLTAALLQLGPDRTCMFSASCAGTSVTQSPVALDDVGENEANDFDHRSTEKRATWADCDVDQTQEFAPQDSKAAARQRNNVYAHEKSYWTEELSQERTQRKTQLEHGFMETQVSHESEQSRLNDDSFNISFKDPTNERRLSPTKLDDIWGKVIKRCRSLPLQQLLNASVTLTSVSITEVDATIHLEIGNPAHKSSCERSQKSISYLFEMVLGFPVDIKFSLASLPAEGEDLRATQDSAGNHIHIYPEGTSSEGYDWRKRESITKSHIPHQSHALESFPAIHTGAASVENQRFVGSTWKSAMCENGGKRTEYQSATHKMESAISHQEPRGLSLMTGSAPGGTATYRVHGQYHKGDTNGYNHNQAYDDINAEEERIMDEVEDFSPSSSKVADLHDKSRLRQCACKGSKGGQALHGFSGCKSCNAEAKQKGGSSKMVRRLSMRNHGKSSDPNSPDEKGSYLRVPRFSIKSHTNPQKFKDLQSPREESEQFVDLEEAAASTQKKGILKGAVGGFARLFQGKLSK